MDGNEVSLKRKRVTCLLVVIAILAASFLVMDWLLFFRCGAVEQCLVGGSVYQNVAKFAVTAFAALVVFLIGKDCLSSRDRTLLQAAFVMAVCADFCMKIVSGYALVGIGFFMAVQTLLIVRHTRRNDGDNSFPRILCIPFGAGVLAAALAVSGVFSGPKLPIVAAYGVFVICSLIAACRASKKGFFPAGNARQIKWGMILFFCCDVCVGVSGLVSADHSVQEIVATVAHNLVWMFYTPALVLLALSGYRQDA